MYFALHMTWQMILLNVDQTSAYYPACQQGQKIPTTVANSCRSSCPLTGSICTKMPERSLDNTIQFILELDSLFALVR